MPRRVIDGQVRLGRTGICVDDSAQRYSFSKSSPVTLVHYPGQFATLSRLASGVFDVSLENWPNDKGNVIRELLLKEQMVGMYGTLGYVGRISWCIPVYIADLYPNIIFSSWGSMHDPGLLQLLPRAGTTSQQSRPDGSYLHSSRYCQNGECRILVVS
ncbi:hypothetical protein AMAG_17837 [Allomyces macrogynus ATCC 38327]|uniref:Uncharacterized protein n=1 Tax=Allomyces macrogynus (strain ATCC 38327) TaxID=578462 RepID=A0A0L0S0M5_ALLM3|nr:hypothetical protein AMAG_17837 [Allomyces macrogynus ATCC 38327]|eukprot:KNE55894.1 hypothetical protein AMAG_17837 [Allomyces macrogynus ATCC 38327]